MYLQTPTTPQFQTLIEMYVSANKLHERNSQNRPLSMGTAYVKYSVRNASLR
jgi:hypothetical protein